MYVKMRYLQVLLCKTLDSQTDKIDPKSKQIFLQPKTMFVNVNHVLATKIPHCILNKQHKMKVPYKLKQGQSRMFHKLPSGLNMEVIYHKGMQTLNRPPLVFVHGSFHAAWCWAEHWLPFFSQNGFDSYALSLLGQVQFFIYMCVSNLWFQF